MERSADDMGERRDGGGPEGQRIGIWGAADGAKAPLDREHIRILVRPIGDHDGRRVHELEPVELEAASADGELVLWIDIARPGEQGAALLRDGLGIGPLTVEDCLSPLRMPKIDVFPGGHAFLAAFATRLDDTEEGPRLRALEVDLVVAPRRLVTTREAPVEEVEERLQAVLCCGPALGEHAGAVLAQAALDALVDAQLPAMIRAAAVAEELEEQLDPMPGHSSIESLEQLIVLRRDLLAWRRLAVAQGEVLRRLARVAPALAASLSDVGDNQREMVDMADATREYIDGAIEAYRMRRDERTQGDLRRLTVLAAILGPLSLLIGLWGVNFPGIPGTQSPYGWPLFVAALVTLAALGMLYLRRRGLL